MPVKPGIVKLAQAWLLVELVIVGRMVLRHFGMPAPGSLWLPAMYHKAVGDQAVCYEGLLDVKAPQEVSARVMLAGPS